MPREREREIGKVSSMPGKASGSRLCDDDDGLTGGGDIGAQRVPHRVVQSRCHTEEGGPFRFICNVKSGLEERDSPPGPCAASSPNGGGSLTNVGAERGLSPRRDGGFSTGGDEFPLPWRISSCSRLFRGVPPKTHKQFDLLWDDLIRERDQRSCIALIGRNFRGSELVELGMI